MIIEAIDMFSGIGGFTEGAEQAGIDVVWAGNHWQESVNYHAMNHPNTIHACQDLQQANWGDVPRHDLLLAAPACQGHSPARGKERAHHDALRATAWAVIGCAEVHLPQVIVVENVPAFANWRLYYVWCEALRSLGYSLAEMIIDAADHGVPQNRERLFVIATQSSHPIDLKFSACSHQAIGSYIDWDAGNWTPIEQPGRSPATLARVASGRQRFGERFVAPYYGNGSGKTGRSIQRPIGTLTTVAKWSVIRGDRMRMLSVDESARCMGFPGHYKIPKNSVASALKMLGNAVVVPVARDICAALKRHV